MRDRTFLRAAWRHLLMANWEVDPALVAPYVPRGVSLDLEAGRCYVSLVGFRFERTRVFGLPVPFHTSFPEVNLRFYVVRDAADGPRRGVTFYRELVNRPAVAALARWYYNERYRTVPMQYRLDLAADGRIAPSGQASYQWFAAGRWNRLSAVRCGPWQSVADDRHVEFIVEHFYGYGVGHDGRTIEYRVDRDAWQWCRVQQVRFDCDIAAVYGEAFARALAGPPTSAFLINGSPVRVTWPTYFDGALAATGPATTDEASEVLTAAASSMTAPSTSASSS
jgi:uncharacterized protein YqjF (DUF2071 family)